MAITNTYILSPDFIKSFAPFINGNVDNDLIELSILEAQEVELQGILGSKLYDSVITKINNDTLSGDTTYLSLVDDYCVKVVLYYTIKRALVFLSFKFNNKNIGEQNSDNTTPVDFKTIDFLSSKFDNDASDYSQKLINHLLDKGNSLYSEYDTETDLEDIGPNKQTTYLNGMDLTSVSLRNKPNCRL